MGGSEKGVAALGILVTEAISKVRPIMALLNCLEFISVGQLY